MRADEPGRAGRVPGDWIGLGLDYGTVGLVAARAEWSEVAERLADALRGALGESSVSVEHVGSTAVPGLAAKPIIDLAVGVRHHLPREAVRESLEGLGYDFRGDAGDAGGLVFVLSDRPQHRVAHAHVVEYAGSQWDRYLAFRNLLLRHESARAVYERAKSDLAEKFPNDRKSYQAAKEGVVNGLLKQYTTTGE